MGVSTEFRSIYRHGFARVAACTTRCTLADPAANAAAILEVAQACHRRGVALAVFPELGLSGYAISDLLQQSTLLDAVEAAVADLVAASADLLPLLLVGAPLRHAGALYNCALAIHRGRLLGVVPKVHLPNYREFYEPRHFVAGDGMVGGEIAIGALTAPFGTDLLFAAEDVPGLDRARRDLRGHLGPGAAELRRRRWPARRCSPICRPATSRSARRRRGGCCAPRSRRAASRPICTPRRAPASPPPISPGTARPRSSRTARRWPRPSASRRPASSPWPISTSICCARSACRWAPSTPTAGAIPPSFRRIAFRLDPPAGDIGLERKVERFPFVPADPARLEQDCYEAYNIQVSGLAQRLRATGIKRVVIGVSGGLDSTHALIVCGQALDLLGLPRANILAYTMPGFATSAHTKANAIRLMEALGVTWQELDIRPAARTHAEPTSAIRSRTASRSTT